MPFPEHLQHLIQNDQPLAQLTWLGIGGPARYFAEPHSREQLIELVQAASKAEIPVRLLGSGSNVLVRESGFDGLVLSLAASSLSTVSVAENQLTAAAGAKLSHAITHAVGEGLGGLEHLAGIPGTVGAAVSGNVSAAGGDIGSLVEQVEVMETDGTIRVIPKEDLQFSYRKSNLSGLLILSVTFALEKNDAIKLTKRLQKFWIVAQNQRPDGEPRLAQPFIDPDGFSADDLIQQSGMGGMRLGNASLTAGKPNYLLAHSGATSDDIVQLLARVREQVSSQSGIDLQLNLQIW
ncbi:UDP-N-acetylenolpyruvoylglucosamine reductase MurB [Roseimaritima multifibrata]|uniref:UDP-N-acetylenolpyruvoylglucosamine reductase n=1 Tax=Roseimaritima multifibrata TaxID=1930274 RepID=A0A517MBT8_9BACT|nr:UDP-N-acetylmuramate dehydrogenase [Roseimaritima multifibrata]QDS92354.1 UDP-N-acetylenolpyruvoylglucosamine reductase MurB [Roseimaritima multifibrata]